MSATKTQAGQGAETADTAGRTGERARAGQRGRFYRADAAAPAPGHAADAPLTGLQPVLSPHARLLILGSFPGVASLAEQRYYAHPRNAFWPIVSSLVGRDLVALPYAQRLDALRGHGIALWDVIAQCHRQGSLDSAIQQAQANVFVPVLQALPALQAVAFNGQRAAREAPAFAALGYRTFVLPSTSPAHAGLDRAAKLAAWSVLAPWVGGGSAAR